MTKSVMVAMTNDESDGEDDDGDGLRRYHPICRRRYIIYVTEAVTHLHMTSVMVTMTSDDGDDDDCAGLRSYHLIFRISYLRYVTGDVHACFSTPA